MNSAADNSQHAGRDDKGRFEEGNTLQAPPILADPTRQKQLIELVKLGSSLAKAAALVGVADLHTVRSFRKANPKFDEEVREAERLGFVFVLKVYAAGLAGAIAPDGATVGSDQLNAAKHYLACKDPEGWSRTTKHQLSGEGGGPIQSETTVKVLTDLERCSREFDQFAAQLLRAGDVPPDGAGESVPADAEPQP